jgi:secreted trypsin-like serine protease
MTRSTTLLIAALVATLAACGGDSTPISTTGPTPTIPPTAACDALGQTADASIAIVNGVDCSSARSAVVLLNIRDRDGFGLGSCSGTIIAPRAVLTAAHCLDEAAAIVRIWLGSGSEIPAQSFEFHPSYRPNSATALDVGIVRMGEDLPRTPIPLLTSRDARVGETAVLAGWGRDESSVPSTLRAGSATISGVGAVFLETQHTTNASSICSGDSGGPLMLQEGGRWAVAGISSAASVATCNTGTNFYVNIRNPTVMSYILDLVPEAGRR